MVCAVLLGLLTQVPAASSSTDTQQQQLQEQQDSTPSLQQIISLVDYLQNGGEVEFIPADGKQNDIVDNNNNNKLKVLANAYEELLKRNLDTKEQIPIEKRAKYMSLCHFKICNMGRKRTPYESVVHNKRSNNWPLNWLQAKLHQ